MDVPRPHPNNGKITGQTDVTSGEQVVYTYDALNRLATAGSTSSSWGQSYSYDGFGNLQDQNVTAGTAPSLSVTYNASTNRQTTDSADANGNISSVSGVYYMYDVSNRIVSATGGISYSYAPGNKRIWKGIDGGSGLTTDVITFWSVNGQKLGDYNMSGDPTISYPPPSVPPLTAALATSYYYFGGKLIKNGGGYVGSDRLGSVGKYYPWGQEKPSVTTNGTEKFTGYMRDAETGLDYAVNRYHQPGMGRFLTPDPYMASGGPADPGSWNRYAYVGGDPIKYTDRTGRERDDCGDDWMTDPSLSGPCDGGWGWGGGGGGGGGGGNPLLGADPNWQTPGQRSLKVQLWDAAIAAALAAEQAKQQGGQPGYRYVAYLQVTGDCYQKQVYGSSSVVRVRTYQAYDEFGNVYADPNLTITEHNYVQYGSLSAYGSTWHVDANGDFVDYLSKGSGPDTTEYQQFTASNSGGLNFFGNAPVMVYDPMNYGPNAPGGQYFGTLGITLNQSTVFINGTDGKTNGQLNYCK